MKKVMSLLIIGACLIGNSKNIYAKDSYNVMRISGNDRYETSLNIANNFFDSNSKNVIIANGENFPDAISGSILSKKLDSPILLVKKNRIDDRDFGNYIAKFNKEGHVYILGGNFSVDNEYENVQSYIQTKRLYGQDRFETNSAIVNYANVEKGTPVIIINGVQFADALSVSSESAVKGYPIIMSTKDKLSDTAVEMLKNIQPSKVFIIGGQGSISNLQIASIKNTVKSIDDSKIIRISGSDRYETSINVCKYFNLDGDTVILASGEDFPDALSGSALAAKFNSPIILTNGKDISTQKKYLDSTNYKKVILLGGKGSVSEEVENTLSGTTNDLINFPDKNLEAIIRRSINRTSGDIYTNDVKGIQVLDASSSSISNLDGIEKLTNLKSLNLSGNSITSLKPLNKLSNLENLNLSYNSNLSDLSGIEELISLKELNLYLDNITNLEAIKDLVNLENLDLGGNEGLKDISPITNLNKLASLKLNSTKIKDMSLLEKLNNLKTLSIGYNDLSDINSLKNLKNLTALSLDNNKLRDLTPLKELKNLTALSLNSNEISNIDVLSELNNLKTLSIYGNNIMNISNLKKLINLNQLELGNNNISDISDIRSLTSLSELGLSSNKIVNIDAIRNLTNLSELRLNKNAIKDFSSVKYLNNLQKLILDSNEVNDSEAEQLRKLIPSCSVIVEKL